jgi:hypothetical protein
MMMVVRTTARSPSTLSPELEAFSLPHLGLRRIGQGKEVCEEPRELATTAKKNVKG